MLERALIVNTADRGGGAEEVAMTLLDGFQELGTETWLAVGAKHTGHPRVVCIDPAVQGGAVSVSPRTRKMADLRSRMIRPLGLEDFEYPGTRHLLELMESSPDVVLCGNLHGGYFDLRLLPWLSRQQPLVLQLADSWTFTGHCACPLGCGRWTHGCGRCPDLTIPPAIPRDATRLNWHRKRRILERSSVFLLTPSQWLMDRARRSLLAPAIAGEAVVPNGVDRAVFSPGSYAPGRAWLGVAEDALLMLYVAHGGEANPYKDYATIAAAIGEVVSTRPDREIELVVVGGEEKVERIGERARVRHVPYCGSHALLAELYRAADLYVHAAPEESFCLTAVEALACGTPAVAAAAGGITEVIEHGRTGLLTPPGAPRALAAAVGALVDDRQLRAGMGARAAVAAAERFDRADTVPRIHSWCSELAERERGGYPVAAGAKP